LDLRQLKCFIAVAEEMHFGRAAERLHMAPTALSRMVKTLEEEIGVPLLRRTTRAVSLTRAGLHFLEDARTILIRTEDAARNARDAAEGSGMTLRIGAIDAASASFLPTALQELRRRHPRVDIRLVEAMTAPQLQMLRTGRLDIALARPPLSEAEFPYEVLREEKLAALLPAGHPLAAKSGAVPMPALARETIIIPAKRARPYAYDLVMAYFATVNVVPTILQETTEKPAMLATVATGAAIALAPDWIATFGHPGVVIRPISHVMLDDPLPGALVGMAWRDQQRHKLRDEFMGILREKAAVFAPIPDVNLQKVRIAGMAKTG
jgi:DNA-binding transcriptional LysR family regulator